MTRAGRALGPGKLQLVKRGDGPAQYVLDWMDAQGCRRRQVLAFDRRTAERKRGEIIRQRDLEVSGLGSVEGQSRSLDELKQLYLADLRQRADASHVATVDVRLTRMFETLHAKRVRDLQPIDLAGYQSKLLSEHKSHRTVNCTIGALKAMLNWAVANSLIAENPIRNFKPLPYREEHQTHVRRALSEAEITKFLDAAHEDDVVQSAYRAAETTIRNGTKGAEFAERRRLPRVPQVILWRVLIETGARWGELTRTTWEDLDHARHSLRLRATTTKSGKSRVIPLSAATVAELTALRTIHQCVRQRLVQPGDRIFLSPEGADWPLPTNAIRRILRRVLERAGIRRKDATGHVLDVHALRHTAATRMARNGVPIVVAQRMLGHASIDMTARVYTHLAVDDLREAVIDRQPNHAQTA